MAKTKKTRKVTSRLTSSPSYIITSGKKPIKLGPKKLKAKYVFILSAPYKVKKYNRTKITKVYSRFK